jgi:hypothetical protein
VFVRLSEIHPQQTSEQLPPNFSERLHSSDGEAPWNDRHGRNSTVNGVRDPHSVVPKATVE